MPTRGGAARAPQGRDRRQARNAAFRRDIAGLRATATGRNRRANNRTAQELVFAARGRGAPRGRTAAAGNRVLNRGGGRRRARRRR